MSDRSRILETLRETLEPLQTVLAFYEAGSRATGRYDDLSDLDLIAIVEDDAVAATVAAVPGTVTGRPFTIWRG